MFTRFLLACFLATSGAAPAQAEDGLAGSQFTFGINSTGVDGDNASTTELRFATARRFERGVSLQFDIGVFGNDETIEGVSDTDGFKNLRLLTSWQVNDHLTLGASASYIKIEREETDSLALHGLWSDDHARVEVIVEAFEAPTDTATYLGTAFTLPVVGRPDLSAFGKIDWIDGAALDRERAEFGVRRAFGDQLRLGASYFQDDQYGDQREFRVAADYSLSTGSDVFGYVGAGPDSTSIGASLRYGFGDARRAPLFDLSLFSAAFR